MLGLAIVLLGLFSTVMFIFLDRVEQNLRSQWGQSLKAVLNTTHDAFHHWSNIQREMVSSWANNPQLVQLVEDLLKLPRDKDQLEGSFELDDLRNLMKPAIRAHKYIGFRVISTDRFVIAARHPKGVGAKPVLRQYSTFLDRAFAGKTLLTPRLALSTLIIKAPCVQPFLLLRR